MRNCETCSLSYIPENYEIYACANDCDDCEFNSPTDLPYPCCVCHRIETEEERNGE